MTLVRISPFARHTTCQLLTRPQIITAGVTADIIVGTEYGMGKHMSLNETSAQLSAILKVRTLPLHMFALINAN